MGCWWGNRLRSPKDGPKTSPFAAQNSMEAYALLSNMILQRCTGLLASFSIGISMLREAPCTGPVHDELFVHRTHEWPIARLETESLICIDRKEFDPGFGGG